MLREIHHRRPAAQRKPRRRFTRDDFQLWLLTLPATVWYIAFCYLPLFGIVFAFKKYRLAPGKGFVYSLFVNSKWVGFDNFKFLFLNPNIGRIFANTLTYNIVFLLIGITLPVLLAVMMSHLYSRKLAKTCQTAMFLPHFLSWVVVSYFVYTFLSTDRGLFNTMLKAMGQDPVAWYQSPRHWPFIIVFINTWKTVGYSMIIYIASITSMNKEMFESAMIDGASIRQQVWYITLPNLRPIISIMFILNTGHLLNTDFGLFYHVTRDSNALSQVTQTIDVYVYKALIQEANYGFSSAVGLMQSAIGCVLIILTNIVVKRIDPNSGLF